MNRHLNTIHSICFQTEPYACSYIPGQTATLDFRLISQLAPEAYEQLLSRGWRRFGTEFFRPACADCAGCRSLRIDVGRFEMAQRHRRNLKRNAEIEVVVQLPSVTPEHLALFNAYHADMHHRRGWPERAVDESEYAQSFLAGDWEFAREFQFRERGRLVGVGLSDVLPNSLSSIYFYHAPAWRPCGPGVFSVLKQWEYAQQRTLRHQYLGYWVERCPSMAYKSQYRPHEILQGAPADNEAPCWAPGENHISMPDAGRNGA